MKTASFDKGVPLTQILRAMELKDSKCKEKGANYNDVIHT
jgi:hypothetical protein